MRATLSFVLLSAVLAAAQAPPSSKLVTLRFLGSQRFSSQDISAASGLKLGSMVGTGDLDQAVQRLGDTGAFEQVTYAYSYSAEGMKVDFQVKDGGQFVPARFDNFVWLKEAELLRQLHARVPLFDGKVPLAGSLLDQVAEALAQVLKARGIPATASYLRGGALNGPIDSVIFSVQGPAVRIHAFNFPGATGDFPGRLQYTAARLAGSDYLQSRLSILASIDLMDLYLRTGYLHAHFLDPVPHVVQDSPQNTLVDVELPVQEGLQYKVKDVEWEGNSAFSAAQLGKLLHLVPGTPANQVQLWADLEAVQKLYGTRAYLRAQIAPQPLFDDATASVSYRLKVNEGDLYHFDRLSILGLDPDATTRLQKTWRLHAGDPYDQSYPKRFLDEVGPLLPLAHWGITVHEDVDEKQKAVAVTLRFAIREEPPR